VRDGQSVTFNEIWQLQKKTVDRTWIPPGAFFAGCKRSFPVCSRTTNSARCNDEYVSGGHRRHSNSSFWR
jgi:hypothetical protein